MKRKFVLKEESSSPLLSFESCVSLLVILTICPKMPSHMTFQQKQIIKNLKKIFEKNAKAMSHIQYLNLCKENEVIPKGLNLANLIKSEELWKGNESKILEALNGTSKNIVLQLHFFLLKKN